MINYKLLKDNEHILDKEIQEDIEETEMEITNMQYELEAFYLKNDRLSIMRAAARESGIKERQEFVEKLKKILSDRAELRDLQVQSELSTS